MRPCVVTFFGTFHRNVPVFGAFLIVLKVAPPSIAKETVALPKGKSTGSRAVSHVIVCVEPTVKISPPLGEVTCTVTNRSEERRVGKEWRSRWSPDHLKKKKQHNRGKEHQEYLRHNVPNTQRRPNQP